MEIQIRKHVLEKYTYVRSRDQVPKRKNLCDIRLKEISP